MEDIFMRALDICREWAEAISKSLNIYGWRFSREDCLMRALNICREWVEASYKLLNIYGWRFFGKTFYENFKHM